jgi:DNA-binding NarL/FixJ family response regulator
MALRIVIAEDNFLVREGIRRMLGSDSDLDVIGAAGDLDELLRLIDELRPDVVLTDIRMPPNHRDEGLRAAEYCREQFPEMGVILLSQYIESDYVRILLEHGTDRRGYLLKERVAELDDLVLALREVSKGGSALDPKVVEALVHNRSAQHGTALARLTPRELDVLEVMAQGHTNSAIADELVLSVRAVEKHINSIFSKLDLSGDQSTHPRVRAVLLYLAEESPRA